MAVPITTLVGYAQCRDFVYFGHGSDSFIGTGNATFRISDAQLVLTNNLTNPLTATNIHPYRYVFLDGCNTADGSFPQAFGIPKQKGMRTTDFTAKRGIRPRAFMGWNREKASGMGIIAGGGMNTDHMNYITAFWSTWAARNPTTGGPINGVKQAVTAAAARASMAAGGMQLYGAEDLFIDY